MLSKKVKSVTLDYFKKFFLKTEFKRTIKYKIDNIFIDEISRQVGHFSDFILISTYSHIRVYGVFFIVFESHFLKSE